MKHKTSSTMSSSSEEESSSESSTSSSEGSDLSRELRRRRKVFNKGKRIKYEEGPKKYPEDEITYSNWQIGLVASLFLLIGYAIYEYEYVELCALKFYANVLGDKDAQHILGQRYYLGSGVVRNKTLAFYWFKEAAKQGHPHASYNLGVLHMQGFHRLERKGEAHKLIKHAAKVGIKEAEHVLKTACAKGECDR